MVSKCRLCSERCNLNVDPSGDWIFTKNCRFVSLLRFDETIGGCIESGGNKQCLVVFTDLINRKNEEKLLYVNSSDNNNRLNDNTKIISVSTLMKNLPANMADIRKLQIRNLGLIFKDGDIYEDSEDLGLIHSLLIEKPDSKVLMSNIDGLCKFHYLDKSESRDHVFVITKTGYEAMKSEVDSNKAFIALAFKDNDDVLKAIRETISSCGYEPIDMISHPHNNFIMDEILECIGDSRFIVCDMSIPNNGAYFEAGYAMGLGRKVILTCSKEKHNDGNGIHFDLKQYNTELWNDLDDLREKLKKRIDCTIG